MNRKSKVRVVNESLAGMIDLELCLTPGTTASIVESFTNWMSWRIFKAFGLMEKK
jgi:hypothetical protein